MNDDSDVPDDDVLGPVVDSFLARLRRGERPAVTDLIALHPELAGEIRDLIPALVNLERLGGSADGLGSALRDWAAATGAGDEGPSPQRLGDYLILRRIGGGGMGVVYEAEHESLKSRVALKVVQPRLRADPKYLRRFHAEARVAAGLHHTNIVTVFDYGDHDGVCYYAMQYIQGQPLDRVLADIRRLRDEGTEANVVLGPGAIVTIPAATASVRQSAAVKGLLTGHFSAATAAIESPASTASVESSDLAHRPLDVPVACSPGPTGPVAAEPAKPESSLLSELSDLRYFREIARVGAQVADALEYAHRRGVLHRDIKPSNLLLDAMGNIWVTDFGLAKLEEGDDLSHSRELVGTLRYMAPERLSGQSNRRGDIYSLGATLYELLAFRPPFEDSDQMRLIERIRDERPAPPRQLGKSIPRDLETIVLKTLAKDPLDRFASAGELADELRRFVEGRTIRSRPVSIAEQFWRWCKRDPWLAGANIAAVVLAILLSIVSSAAAIVSWNNARALSVERSRSDAAALAARWRAVDAYIAQARAERFSRRPGQRFASLAAVGEASKLLDALPPGPDIGTRRDELRDLAIASMTLPDLQPAGRVISRPPGVIAVAFDPTMTRYALNFLDGRISVRRVADDFEIALFRGQTAGEPLMFRFSAGGRYLASSPPSGIDLTVWDLDERRIALVISGPVGQAASFSPDSRGIVAYRDGQIVDFNLATGQPARRWPGHMDCVVFRPDGAQIAVVDNESNPPVCRILDWSSWRLIRSIPLRTTAEHVAWSHDGATLALMGWDSRIDLWDAATSIRQGTFEGHYSKGVDGAFHPAGTLLVSQGNDRRLKLWDPIVVRPVLDMPASGRFHASEDGRIVVEHEDQMTTYRLDPALEYRSLAIVTPGPVNYSRPSVRHDGRLLAVGMTEGSVLWDLAHGRQLAILPSIGAWHLKFTRSGDLITSGGMGVRRWPIHFDPDLGRLDIGPSRLLDLPKGVNWVAADDSGEIVAKADGTYAYVATQGGTKRVGPLNDCRHVDVCPDGQWLATSDHAGNRDTLIWRISDLARMAQLAVGYETPVRFSPDGKWLITTRSPCRLWEVGTWREVRRVGDAGGCFTPDGRLMAVGDLRGITRLLETTTGRTLARLEGPDFPKIFAEFSPDASRLVLTTNNGLPSVHVWDLRAIRKQLAEMKLDWDAPAYSDHDPAARSAPVIRTILVRDLEHAIVRAEALAYQGQWDAAAAAYAEGFRYGTTNRQVQWFERAILSLATGDTAGYRLSCQHMLDEMRASSRGSDEERSWLDFASHACALSPDAPVEHSQALSLAERRDDLERVAWSEHVRELALYRAGRYEEVESRLLGRVERDADWKYSIFNWSVLAMAEQRLGNGKEARRWLDRAEKWIEGRLSNRPVGLDRAVPDQWLWRDAMLMHMLVREAHALIGAETPVLPRDVFAPAH